MTKNKTFTYQLIIIGGFIVFFYIFFALATQIYKDYKLQKHIETFEENINELAVLARQKPEDIAYFSSTQYKDRYAKESLNLLNPGEKLIVIPQEEQNIVKGTEVDPTKSASDAILALPNHQQWWAYFFGDTLSIKNPNSPAPAEQVVPDEGVSG